MAACAQEERSEWTEACEEIATGNRLEDEYCDDDDDDGHVTSRYLYFPGDTQITAVGQKLPSGGSGSRPAGTIGHAPPEGGFGTYVIESGSGSSGS
jgi:hypothetical protein